MALTEDEASPKPTLIARVIEASARQPFMTLVFAIVAGVWGYYSLRNAPLDAIPDLSDTQVIIFTEWQGRSPDLVEDQITYPISTFLLAAPQVKFVRGQSFFGLSFVSVIFEDGTDMYWARSRVLEYLNSALADLPDGVRPTLGPDATGVGWVFQYALVDRSGKHDLQELRSFQDWNLRYALESVPGVAEVASVGGFVKEYQVQVDPVKLRAYGVGIADVVRAVRESNEDAGGRTIEIAGHEQMIRGRGYIHSEDDLRKIPVKLGAGGTPVLLDQIAVVSIGPSMRRGIAELNGEGEVVGGIVIMRYGENALSVIDAVKQRIEDVRAGLPDGTELVITYDRSDLIKRAIGTLRSTLIEEMIVVSVIIFLFLLHARSALVPIITLPLAVILSFIPMYYQNLTANIMSLGGIAVAIGAMVDASIIVIENIHKKLEDWDADGQPGSRQQTIVAAMQEVGPSIFFSLLVITVSFLPVFTLESAEGRLFKPLAFTKTYSMGFAAILSVTLIPALAVLMIRGKIRREEENPLNRWLIASYAPVVRFVVAHRRAVIVFALVAMGLTVPAFLKLQSEFMPPLNEGTVLYMPTAPPGMSVTEASNVLQAMDRQLKSFPEVVSVFGKAGRAETATDPAPIGMLETTIVLKPRDEWRAGLTWKDLIQEMDETLRYPGMPNIFWMPVQTRTEMLATGIRSPLGIQVFGNDLETIEHTAVQIEHAVSKIPGTRSAFAERSAGGFFIDFEVDREKAARYGLRVADVNEVIMTAVGGMAVSETVEGRERYPITVRYAREFRDDPSLLGEILISTKAGAQVPISQVVDLNFVMGPPMVRSENGKLVGFVFVDTDRPIAQYVEDAKGVIADEVTLPAGVWLGWAGQFKYLERAKEKLKMVVPVTLFLVMMLLYWNTKSWAETAMVMLAVPFSLIGAVWLLFFLDYNLSVAVWVGMIALAGLDAETGVVMLLYLTLAHKKSQDAGTLQTPADLTEAIVDGAARRIRPKLMTVMTTTIALLPILWSTGTGADVMKRIAAPMVGGLVTSFLLELTVYPAIFAAWKGRSLPALQVNHAEGNGDNG
ncbi:MAG: CusA/CzcA family heavy metal efflux RND transporter [Myxococcales bacterium]|nr:CusA/CzcA family heavy metal efflux RND transporter [Myxococcales bacterium]